MRIILCCDCECGYIRASLSSSLVKQCQPWVRNGIWFFTVTFIQIINILSPSSQRLSKRSLAKTLTDTLLRGTVSKSMSADNLRIICLIIIETKQISSRQTVGDTNVKSNYGVTKLNSVLRSAENSQVLCSDSYELHSYTHFLWTIFDLSFLICKLCKENCQIYWTQN